MSREWRKRRSRSAVRPGRLLISPATPSSYHDGPTSYPAFEKEITYQMEFSAVDFFETLGVTFAALFPIVNPLGCAPIFFGLTHNYPQSAQKVLAHKIAAYGFALLLISALFGSEILAFFGISLFVVQIAGGLVVAVTGWNLLNQPEDDSPAKPCTGNAPGRARSCLLPADTPAHRGSGRHFHRNHAWSSSQIPGRSRVLPTAILATLSRPRQACFSSACW